MAPLVFFADDSTTSDSPGHEKQGRTLVCNEDGTFNDTTLATWQWTENMAGGITSTKAGTYTKEDKGDGTYYIHLVPSVQQRVLIDCDTDTPVREVEDESHLCHNYSARWTGKELSIPGRFSSLQEGTPGSIVAEVSTL